MHSQSDPNKTHFYVLVGDNGGAMSACGHLMSRIDELDLKELDPFMTTCAGCLRSRHYKRALKQAESATC